MFDRVSNFEWGRRGPLAILLWIVGVILVHTRHRTAALVFVLGGGAVGEMLMRLVDSRRDASAQTWPMTQATVESGHVVPAGHGRLLCEIAYSYSVSNEYYSGFYERGFYSEQEATSFVEALKGKTILVNYNSQDHGASRLTDSALRAAIPDPSVLRESRWKWLPLLGPLLDFRASARKR
jgi:Protein of unknown function (DUF3592)